MTFRRLMIGLFSALLCAGVFAGSASAAEQRPLAESFGPDGTTGTTFNLGGGAELRIGYQQSSQRFYVMPMWAGEGLRGFDESVAGTHAPLGAPFPLTAHYPGFIGGFAVDNSSGPSAGRLYEAYGANFTTTRLWAWDASGNLLGTPFPIEFEPPSRFCSPAVDSKGNVAVSDISSAAVDAGNGVLRFTSKGIPLSSVDTKQVLNGTVCALAFGQGDDLFAAVQDGDEVRKFTASSNYTESARFASQHAESIAVDKSTGHVFFTNGREVLEYEADGTLIRRFGITFGIYSGSFDSIAVNEARNQVYVSDSGLSDRVHVFGPPATLPDVSTDRPTKVTTTSALLHGQIDLAGASAITECQFEYGPSEFEYGTTVPCNEGATAGDVTASIAGLANGQTYHYRLVATTADGIEVGGDEALVAQHPPTITGGSILEVTSNAAKLTAFVNPTGVRSFYKYEYGLEDCAVSACQSSETVELDACMVVFGFLFCPEPSDDELAAPIELTGLSPDTVYHTRVVAFNDQDGVEYGSDFTFHTFAQDPAGIDPCPNAHVRKQTGASKLPHCRAYELVSAKDSGGYDVTSNLVPGEQPLAGHPDAADRFLYTLSSGRVPGAEGFPVNFGTDPYVADRTSDGWETRYVGIPANAPSATPFASTAMGTDAGLSLFAFGDQQFCQPCFQDGSSGIPVRMPDGVLVQGMRGSLEPTGAQPEGEIAKAVSADGEHLVFGSEAQFEPAGNNGSLTIYQRDLMAGATEAVSTMPDGSTMTGPVAELDLAEDGSRVLIGKLAGTDGEGNKLYDLYMHLAGDPTSVLVADTAAGVAYAGMSGDGTEVYFASPDNLADDTDTGIDLFRADVSPGGAPVTRVSTGSGGTGDVDSCEPPNNWNVIEGGPEDCSVLPFGGGGGAGDSGAIYFMSPEQLDGAGNGIAGQPNVYYSEPGSSPDFVGLLDNSLIKPPPPPPKRPLINETFGGAMSQARALAVDQATGWVYVAENGSGGRIARFDEAGQPVNFTAGTGAGTNRFANAQTGNFAEAAISVDNAPSSPFKGSFYVRQGTTKVLLYASTGLKLGELTGFSSACGVSVDPQNGDVYVADRTAGLIRRFRPTSGTTPVTNANYTITAIKPEGLQPCQAAVDTAGHVYATNFSNGPVRRYPTSAFAAVPPTLPGTEIDPAGRSVAIDPVTNEVFVNRTTFINAYDASGSFRAEYGVGQLTNSGGIAINSVSGHMYATQANNAVREFGYEPIPFKLIDNPAIDNAIADANTRHTEDFQVTRDGDIALFVSKFPQDAYPTDGHFQVFKHVRSQDTLTCVSCPRNGVSGTGDAYLASQGSSLSDDGRVFFTTPDQLTLRDTNRKGDAYEYDGDVHLVSSGASLTDAALATVDSSGQNVYFFTRESLVPQDENGATMKVYTAREQGGFSFLADPLPCQASDECHGPGTAVAPPPAIGTYKGVGGNVESSKGEKPRRCRKGFTKRGGKCIRKKRRSRHGERRSHHNEGRANRG